MPKAAPAPTTSAVEPVTTPPDLSCLPSLYEVGRQIRLLRAEHDRLDNAILALPKTLPAHEPGGEFDLRDADRLALDREDALRDLLGVLPARDTRDAAMQLHEAWLCIDGLNANDDKIEDDCRRLNRLILSALRVVAKEAGLDLAEMGSSVSAHLARAFGVSGEETAR